MIRQGTTVGFVYRLGNKPALDWANKISLWLNKTHPEIKVVDKRAKILLVLGLDKFFKGNFSVIQRMMLKGDVVRNGKIVFTTNALNEVAVQNLLGIVELGISIDRDSMQTIRGTGALVSTATGSTAYNLSAHGPIVMPDIECFIVTELMDHNIPSPSIVVKKNKNIHLKVVGFRERGLLSVSLTGEKADVMLIADGSNIFPLKEKGICL